MPIRDQVRTIAEKDLPPCHRKEWRLPPILGEWVVVRWWDVTEGEETFYEPSLIRISLRKWLRDPHHEMLLRQLCNGLWADAKRPPTLHSTWEPLLARLEEAFRLGRLALVRQRSVPLSGGGHDEEPWVATAFKEDMEARKPPKKEARKEKTWIAVRLVDITGRPVPHERYRIVLPDRSVQEGSLDEAGHALVEQINPGQCDISFPDLDARDWSAA
jgi:hypothetical protein